MSKLEPDEIDVTGMSEAHIVKALWDASAPLGRGFEVRGSTKLELSIDEALASLDQDGRFDKVMWPGQAGYVKGRPIKIGFDYRGDRTILIRADLYDRDNGEGQTRRVIDKLMKTKT